MAGRNRNELLEQRHVIHSVRKVGGYGKKISNQLQSGLPDLLLVVPGFAPGIWEMKDLGEVRETFRQKVDTTVIQKTEMMEFQNAAGGRGVTGVLVTYKMRNFRWLTLCPRDTTTIHHTEYPTIIRETGQFYSMPDLFKQAGMQEW